MDEDLEEVLRRKDDGALSWICAVCSELGELVYCDLCKKGFHIDEECLGSNKAPEEDEWVCSDCLAAKVECFACKEQGSTGPGGDIVVCSRRDCAKFFHESCLEDLEGVTWGGPDEDRLVCPQHSCRACDQYMRASKLYKCLLCPVAYHEQCAPEGSHLLEEIPSHCICWRHDSDWKQQAKKLAPTNNVTEVFGRLAVPLVEIDFELPPEVLAGDSDDEDVVLRPRRPQAEPASSSVQEVTPEGVPEITKKVDTGACAGSGKENAKPEVSGNKRGWGQRETEGERDGQTVKKLKRQEWGVREEAGSSDGQEGRMDASRGENGREAESSEQQERENQEADAKGSSHSRKEMEREKPPYAHIDQNVWLVPRENWLAPLENQAATWQVPSFSPGKKLELHKVRESEWSVEAAEDAEAHDFLVEYVGEVVDSALCHQRVAALEKKGVRNMHLCQLDDSLVLDAYHKGNLSRFVPHSRRPNCQLQRWRVAGELRVGLFAMDTIKKGDSLAYDYKAVAFGSHSVDDFPVRVPTPCDGPAATAPSPPSPRRADVHPPPSESGSPDPQTSARPCAQPESAGRGVAPQTKSEESNKPADEFNKVEASDPSPSLVDKARSPAESPAEKPKSPAGDGESRRESHKSPVESPVESPPSRKRQSGANARPLDGLTEHASSSLATPPLKSRSSSPAFAEPVLPNRPAPKEEPSSQQSDPVAAPEGKGVQSPGLKGPGEEDSPIKAQSVVQERSAQMQRDRRAKKREVLDDDKGGAETRKVQRGKSKAVSHEQRSPEAVPRRQRPKRREDVSDERSKETDDEEAVARRREKKRARSGSEDEAGDKRDRRHREERRGRLESAKKRGREEGRDRRRGERGDVKGGREEDRRRSRASLRVGGDRKQTPGEERVERRERLKRAQEDSPGGGLARELRRLGGVKEEKAHNRGRSAGRLSGASPERGSDKRRPRWEEEKGAGRKKEVRATTHGDERLPNKKRGRPPHKARNEERAQGESDSGRGKSPVADPNEANNGPASPRRGPAGTPPVALAPPSPSPARPSSSHTAQSSPQPIAPPVHAAPPQPVVSASIATSPVPGEGGGLRAEAEEREPSGVGPLAAAESAAVGGGRGVRQDDHEEAASPHVPWPRRELPRKAVRREEEDEEETRGRGRGSVEREANGRRAPVQDGVWKPRRVPKWGGRRSRYWVPGYPLNWTAASYLQQHNQLPQPPIEI